MIIYKVVHYPYGSDEPFTIVGPEVGPRHMQSNGEEATFLRDEGGTLHKVAVAALEAYATLEGDKATAIDYARTIRRLAQHRNITITEAMQFHSLLAEIYGLDHAKALYHFGVEGAS